MMLTSQVQFGMAAIKLKGKSAAIQKRLYELQQAEGGRVVVAHSPEKETAYFVSGQQLETLCSELLLPKFRRKEPFKLWNPVTGLFRYLQGKQIKKQQTALYETIKSEPYGTIAGFVENLPNLRTETL